MQSININVNKIHVQIELQVQKSTSPCLYTLFQEGEHGFTLEIHFQEHLENSLFQISRTYTFGITSVQLACDVLHSSALVSATFHRVWLPTYNIGMAMPFTMICSASSATPSTPPLITHIRPSPAGGIVWHPRHISLHFLLSALLHFVTFHWVSTNCSSHVKHIWMMRSFDSRIACKRHIHESLNLCVFAQKIENIENWSLRAYFLFLSLGWTL